jgi:hypothetical protein
MAALCPPVLVPKMKLYSFPIKDLLMALIAARAALSPAEYLVASHLPPLQNRHREDVT